LTAKRVGSDKGGIKFKLTGDLMNAPTFLGHLVGTGFYKALGECGAELDGEVAPSVADDINWDEITETLDKMRDKLTVEIYFWVDAWNHQLTRLSVSVKVSEPKIEFNYDETLKNNKPDIKMPSDNVNFMQIITEMMTGTTVNYDDIYNSYL
jgi:hypothetical protein